LPFYSSHLYNTTTLFICQVAVLKLAGPTQISLTITGK
jgi:hypothetical protein